MKFKGTIKQKIISMKFRFNFIFFISAIYFTNLIANEAKSPSFGYISYSTANIGDDIQAIAAKKILSKNSIPIDREFVHTFTYPKKVNTIVNGWFMHTKKEWYRNDIQAPEKSWPPSPSLNPFFISIHFTKSFIKTALSKEGVKYLKKHGPIGARDYFTLQHLQKKKIPSYFSGCLTLTLDNHYKDLERTDIIYAVDIDKECVDYIKSQTKYKVEVITHEVPFQICLDHSKRIKYGEELLEKYRKAKCVITKRLHAAMPCLAFKTPVLLVGKLDYRFSGLKDLVRHCSKEQLLEGKFDFDFDEPTNNPNNYLIIREKIQRLINEWLQKRNLIK